MPISQVAAGERHSLLLTTDGVVLANGSNLEGQLDGKASNEVAKSLRPAFGVHSTLTIRRIACGARHSLAVSQEGHLYCWGWSLHGQCACLEAAARITMAKQLIGLNIVGIAGGLGHSLACTDAGDLYSWGWNGDGQLGLGDTNSRSRPELVEAPPWGDSEAIKVSAGSRHSVVLGSDQQIYGAGCSCRGELGTERTQEKCTEFQAFPKPDIAQPIHDVECGWWHTSVIFA